MTWELEWGKNEERLEDMIESEGFIPPTLLNKPVLDIIEQELYEDYITLLSLSSSSKVTVQDISAYLDMHGEHSTFYREELLATCLACNSAVADYIEKVSKNPKGRRS